MTFIIEDCFGIVKVNFKELVNSRYSCRDFQDRKVPTEVVINLLDLSRKAPTSCNLQNFSFVILDDEALLAKLSKEVSHKFTYSRTFVLLTMQKGLSVKRSASFVSAGFLADHILLGAAERGISSLAMAGFRNDKSLSRILGIPKSHTVVLLIALGWPRGECNFRSSRISLERLVGVNSFNPSNSIVTSEHPKDWSVSAVADYRSRIGHVYLDRYRLNTVPDMVYRKLLQTFFSLLSTRHGTLKLLDLVSYDGKFLREMSIGTYLRDYKIEATPSDFDGSILDFHSSFLETNGILLTSFFEVQFPDSFDLVTSIFQINYFPQWENQLKYSHRTLKNGGVLFLSIYQDGYLKNLARKLRSFLFALTTIEEMQTNVYENSTHYKSGPFKRISVRELRRAAVQAGFSSIKISRERISRGILYSNIVILVATKSKL